VITKKEKSFAAMKKDTKHTVKDTENISKQNLSISRFVIIYLVLMGIFFLLLWVKPIQNFIDVNGFYTRHVVSATTKILGIIGIPCTQQGSIIALPSIALDVKFGCNGLEAVMIYSVAILAYPADWKKKLVGIVSGFFFLQIVNLLRIVFLAYSGIHFKSIFEYIHIYVAQGIMIVISLGIFFVYLNYAKNSAHQQVFDP
jgi:exosortase H (IPTLxxWG-CTERM-specific)